MNPLKHEKIVAGECLNQTRSVSIYYCGAFSSMNSVGLSSPSSNHGIHTIPKGDCAGCGQPIIGRVLKLRSEGLQIILDSNRHGKELAS